MHTCIPVRGAGVAALVFSPEGAQQLESSAREIGFLFLDIHRLKSRWRTDQPELRVRCEGGGYVEDEPLEREPELLECDLERLSSTNK